MNYYWKSGKYPLLLYGSFKIDLSVLLEAVSE